jgi:hypothetical protein
MHFSVLIAMAIIQTNQFEFKHEKLTQATEVISNEPTASIPSQESTELAPVKPMQPSTEGFDDWYQSVTAQYALCKHVDFAHPICPAIDPNKQAEFKIVPPSGELNSQSLLAATGLYIRGQPQTLWLASLNLTARRQPKIDVRLWAEAQYLYAQILFDQKKFKESNIMFDQAVDQLKGKALFHQERAWAQFFAGEIDRSLGSLFSAMSPLLHPTPYFEKYFLRALVERETCQWDKAFATINAGRVDLQSTFYDANDQPFVKLCDKDQLGAQCDQLRMYFRAYGAEQIRTALHDLDILEMEMQDRGVTNQKKLASSKVIWPFLGEAWQDEIGFYRVKLESQC